MLRRSLGCGLLAMLLIALGGGCKKAESTDTAGSHSTAPETNAATPGTSQAAIPVARSTTVLQLHWLGTRSLLAGTNETGLSAIWNMPETQTLKTQTLSRLAISLLSTSAPPTSISAAAASRSSAETTRLATASLPLLPILDDLVNEESYCEARETGTNSAEVALAIRLSESRSRLWQSNLTATLGPSLGGSSDSTNGFVGRWLLASKTLELSRSGDWTILGLAVQSNSLVNDFAARIQKDHAPFTNSGTNFLLTAELDPARADRALALGFGLPEDLPAISLAMGEDGDGVRTHAELNFSKPLPADFGTWTIPTNLIHEPVMSFTAARGISRWISSLDTWKNLGIGAAPDQVYFWGQSGLPFLTYVAAPTSNASNLVEGLTVKLTQQANAWLDTNGMGMFERATNSNGVIWDDLTVMTPFLNTVSFGQNQFVYGGLETDPLTTRPAPPELIGALFARTNIVAYDWELTGPRIEQWLYFGQFLRFALRHAQIPPKSASFAWLMGMVPHLGNSVTMVSQTGPNQLVVGRRSAIGLTSAELDLLADWLESPAFPHGLNTFLGKPSPTGSRKRLSTSTGSQTNSVPGANK